MKRAREKEREGMKGGNVIMIYGCVTVREGLVGVREKQRRIQESRDRGVEGWVDSF